MFLVKPIRARVFLPPKDNLFSLIKETPFELKEKSIIVFTSKIVSIWQGRCKKMNLIKNKDDLIKKEAELYLEREQAPKGCAILTIKNNTLIPTAGIDESNANGYYILWPKSPFSAAKKIYKFIKKNYGLKNFGVIISDSHCIPLRAGTLGISISYYGFRPLKDYRGKKDIFGRKMKISQLNIADSLAAAATLAMGEGKEQTPIALIEGIDLVKFDDFDSGKLNPLEIKREEDIYAPLLSSDKWKRSRNN
jgi:F420-0:gamma-glutamyl ligase